jgi:hypothetical protein
MLIKKKLREKKKREKKTYLRVKEKRILGEKREERKKWMLMFFT